MVDPRPVLTDEFYLFYLNITSYGNPLVDPDVFTYPPLSQISLLLPANSGRGRENIPPLFTIMPNNTVRNHSVISDVIHRLQKFKLVIKIFPLISFNLKRIKGSI